MLKIKIRVYFKTLLLILTTLFVYTINLMLYVNHYKFNVCKYCTQYF